jgi:peptide chain release factor subunit 1
MTAPRSGQANHFAVSTWTSSLAKVEEKEAAVEITASDIRRLVDRQTSGEPVTSVYLNTDGARFPKPGDYEARLDGLLGEVRRAADADDGHRHAVLADADAISRWVREDFERDGVHGLAVFSSGGDVFETVESAMGLRNLWRVDERPYVVPLEALLGRHHHIALVLIGRDQARIFRYLLGRAWEYMGLASDVHGQHEQGGWSQARFQRNIEHEVLHHMRDTVDVLRKLHESQPVHALVLAGPHHEAAEFRKQLHPYLQQVVHGSPISLALHAGPPDVMERFREIEQELVSSRRADLLARLAAAGGQANRAARGVRETLQAVNEKRVEVLFVVEGAGVPGYRSATGALALDEEEAGAYGQPVEPVEDLIDEVIEQGVRGGAHIELFRDESRLEGEPVAALLRF